MVGETLGNYRITARLGAGGMGEVYRATHLHIAREVAIKVLLPGLAQEQEAVARFLGEARATSLIHHPGIVEVLDCAVQSDGRIHIVMELLSGESLGDALDRKGSFADDIGGACALIVEVAEALSAAHDKGIIHRDLKPDNVFLHRPPREDHGQESSNVHGGDGGGRVRVKVLDFGIAKLVTKKFQAGRQTKTGDVIGTPLYMAPEQCRGHGAVDQRADIYALGCIAYQMLSGRPPFLREGTGDLLIAHVLEAPADISSLVPGVPPALGGLVMQMLAKEPDHRPPTMADVVYRIQRILAVPPAGSKVPAGMGAAARAAAVPAGAVAEDGAQAGEVAGGTRLLPRADETFGTTTAERLRRGDVPAQARRRGAAVVAALAVAVAAAIAVTWLLVRRDRAQPSLDPADSDNAASVPPPALPAPPAPPPARPSAPAEVTIDVTTVPPGAEVWMKGEPAPRGVTPIRVSVARRSTPRDLQLRARGYQERSIAVDGDRDSLVAVELQRLRSVPPTRARPRSTTGANRPPPSERTRQTGQRAGSPGQRSPEELSDPAQHSRYRRMVD